MRRGLKSVKQYHVVHNTNPYRDAVETKTLVEADTGAFLFLNVFATQKKNVIL
jgi:hypothetical protein